MKPKAHIKNTLTLLIILMSVALIGIIVIQIRWINNAVKLKQEAIDRIVNEVLYNTTFRYDNENKLRLFSSNPFAYTDSMVHSQRIITSKTTKNNKKHTVILDHISIPPPPNTPNFRSKNDSNTLTNELNTSSLIEFEQVILNNQHNADSTIHQKNFETIVEQKQEIELSIFINRWQTEYIFKDVLQRINSDILKSILQSELQHRNIHQDFEFAIQNNDSIVYASNNAYKKQLTHTDYKTRLFPKDIFQRPSELKLVFTDKNKLMFQNYGGMMLLSVFFTLAITLIFGISIYHILKQKKLSDMKSDFINNMTHEFKTPLATISLAADSIENPKVIEDKTKIAYFTSMIKQENKRMNNQVERILQVARLERKDVHLNFEMLDMHSIIHDCIDSFHLSIAQKNGTIHFEPEANQSFIEVDSEHLYNVIKNLIDNAIKYSKADVQIHIKTWNTDNGFKFSVADNGIGMNKKVMSKVFEKFYREQHGNVHDVKGHGLGLSYAKSIIDMHKGTIKAESELGVGSSFTVYLPFKH